LPIVVRRPFRLGLFYLWHIKKNESGGAAVKCEQSRSRRSGNGQRPISIATLKKASGFPSFSDFVLRASRPGFCPGQPEKELRRRRDSRVISIRAFNGPYSEGETPCLKSKPTK